MDSETTRLQEDARRERNWTRWGPYLAERQWGTVREDYSEWGSCWDYLPHDHARSRAYRWGEDGLLGITDRECRMAFALALWNGADPILKERLFGLTGPEGNHGEDVKELYYYLDATPTSSYLKGLYRYPQRAYPYAQLVEENRRRGKLDAEFELLDSGVFDGDEYWDVVAEYAKAGPDDLLIRITLTNHAPHAATLHVLPTFWFRNTWSWGQNTREYPARPSLTLTATRELSAQHDTLGNFTVRAAKASDGTDADVLFTDNETNLEQLFNVPNASRYTKDAFHEYVVGGRRDVVNPDNSGTKAAFYYVLEVAAGATTSIELRLTESSAASTKAFGSDFDETFRARMREADEFYAIRSPGATEAERNVLRQAYAGLLWSKQAYHYVVSDWLNGDPAQPAPPAGRRYGRNADWSHVHCRDVISMPDKWEYPWFAAWDLAFHLVAIAHVDPEFAKSQLLLFLREWYMHPNGQIPAYEFAFGDVNPPVHAWAVWRVYKMTGPKGKRDRDFLERAFRKLLINFTWWVNRKDQDGHHLFAGGFLGLDNIGVFDRSQPLPTGGHLEQADGTAWMAFYATTMLAMAMELARDNPTYEDIASKFFEHFIAIADAMNRFGGTGLWDEQDGFYYDQLHQGDRHIPLRIRSMVGVVPLFACEILDQSLVEKLPGFAKRTRWFLENRPDWTSGIACLYARGEHGDLRLLAIPSRERLERVLQYVFDENELLAPNGIRSLSQIYRDDPYLLKLDGMEYRVDYVPAESNTGLFGGNSNWRGPVWFPLNYLLVEALERYHHFYGDTFTVEVPSGSGQRMTLLEAAQELSRRLSAIFLPDASGRRPVHGAEPRYSQNPNWQDLVLFYEYFCGDTGRGVGASHQTGWTALVARLIEDTARRRADSAARKVTETVMKERVYEPAH